MNAGTSIGVKFHMLFHRNQNVRHSYNTYTKRMKERNATTTEYFDDKVSIPMIKLVPRITRPAVGKTINNPAVYVYNVTRTHW